MSYFLELCHDFDLIYIIIIIIIIQVHEIWLICLQMTLFNSAIILQDQGLPASMDKAYERYVSVCTITIDKNSVNHSIMIALARTK